MVDSLDLAQVQSRSLAKPVRVKVYDMLMVSFEENAGYEAIKKGVPVKPARLIMSYFKFNIKYQSKPIFQLVHHR